MLLTTSEKQLPLVALEFKPLFEEEARKRQITLAGTRNADLVELIPEGSFNTPKTSFLIAPLFYKIEKANS